MPDGSRRRTFDLAIETAHALGFERLVSATYRIDDHTTPSRTRQRPAAAAR